MIIILFLKIFSAEEESEEEEEEENHKSKTNGSRKRSLSPTRSPAHKDKRDRKDEERTNIITVTQGKNSWKLVTAETLSHLPMGLVETAVFGE